MNHCATSVISKSAALPITLAEAKLHLRILSDDLDDEVEASLGAAVDYCERVTGRALRGYYLMSQAYRDWPTSPVRLEKQPAISITGVSYYDADGAAQSVATTEFRLVKITDGASALEFDEDFTQPTTDQRADAVTITYTAGYSTVPAAAIHAIKLSLSEFFGDMDARQMEASRSSADRLLDAISWGAYE